MTQAIRASEIRANAGVLSREPSIVLSRRRLRCLVPHLACRAFLSQGCTPDRAVRFPSSGRNPLEPSENRRVRGACTVECAPCTVDCAGRRRLGPRGGYFARGGTGDEPASGRRAARERQRRLRSRSRRRLAVDARGRPPRPPRCPSRDPSVAQGGRLRSAA
jgi:hypothetical protein